MGNPWAHHEVGHSPLAGPRNHLIRAVSRVGPWESMSTSNLEIHPCLAEQEDRGTLQTMDDRGSWHTGMLGCRRGGDPHFLFSLS